MKGGDGSMVIQMNEVKSSNIAAIGYDEEHHVLRVQFNGGRMYDYLAVSAEEKDALLKAESIGRHFGEHIKPKKEFFRVELKGGDGK